MRREKITGVLRQLLAESRIGKAYLFGSFARGEKKYRDIDIAFDPPPHFSLLDLSRLGIRIEEKIGKPVDLVTLRSMHPKIKSIVEREMVPI